MTRKTGSTALLSFFFALLAGCSDSPMGPGAGAGTPATVPPPVGEKSVAWIQITPAGGMIPQAIGTSRQLGVIARALDGTEIVGRTVAWSSSNPSAASVSGSGMLQAHAAGTSWITAVVDGRRDSTRVSVPTLIARIDIDPTELALVVGNERTVSAAAFDANGSPLARTYTWSSSNGAVATVSPSGHVVATGAGTALITAVSESKSATMRVTVTGEQRRLIDAAGGPLPAILYTTTVDARTERFQVTDGTLLFLDGRYQLRIEGWLLVDGADPVRRTLSSAGVVAYNMFTGAPMFFEGDEWANKEPRFRGAIRENGAIELEWSRESGAPVVVLGFAR